jgi:hypothetical protein
MMFKLGHMFATFSKRINFFGLFVRLLRQLKQNSIDLGDVGTESKQQALTSFTSKDVSPRSSCQQTVLGKSPVLGW